MKTSEFLRQAKAVIDTPEKWTKGAMARGERMPGFRTTLHPTDGSATCFCTLGAVQRKRWEVQPSMTTVDANFTQLRALSHLNAVTHKLGFMGIEHFNDNPRTTHDEAMGLFDAAAAAAEREGD